MYAVAKEKSPRAARDSRKERDNFSEGTWSGRSTTEGFDGSSLGMHAIRSQGSAKTRSPRRHDICRQVPLVPHSLGPHAGRMDTGHARAARPSRQLSPQHVVIHEALYLYDGPSSCIFTKGLGVTGTICLGPSLSSVM